MPYIDVKLNIPTTPDQRAALTGELGKAIALMNKREASLMIGIQDNYDLYFGGSRMEKGAYVAVSQLGEPNREGDEAMAARVTEILGEQFGIPPKAVYITFQGFRDWGCNGKLY